MPKKPRVTVKITKIYTLELSEEEAGLLRELFQNPVMTCVTVEESEEETQKMRDLREWVFEGLTDAQET